MIARVCLVSSEQKVRLTVAKSQKEVRRLASVSANIIWTDHVYEQMEQRGIDADDVLKVLRGGYVDEEPAPGNGPLDWKVRMKLRLKDRREVVVVTVIQDNARLILVTAFWRD
jgi:Domain of unknown function (DUF4258)